MNARALLLALLLITALLVATPGTHAQPDSAAGRIAIAGADGNIHLYDLAGESFTQLTSDAVAGAKLYSWPTWSTDGQLAYFGVNAVTSPYYTLGVFVQQAGGEPVQVHNADDEVFTYAYWSPGDCPAGNCRDLALLYTDAARELAVRRIRSLDGGAEFDTQELDTGGPFYWDWSPDGQSMLWTRYNQTLEIYDVASDTVSRTFDIQPGVQRAVDWSPVDDRLLSTVIGPGRGSSLVIFDGDAQTTLAENLGGIVSFAWSPDGSQVAYTEDDGGRLFIADAASAAQVAEVSDNVVGFFWSPDGQKIAYISVTREGNEIITRQGAQTTPVIRWHVYNLDSDTSQRLASFLPSRDMLYYLQFYDQFAHSHSLWSPDSRALVYGELLPDGESVISLLDTNAPGAPPQQIMAGRIGVFAWD